MAETKAEMIKETIPTVEGKPKGKKK